MSIPIVGGFGSPDPDAAPTTLGELVDVLNALLALAIEEPIMPYILSKDIPSVDDQDKVWYRLDEQGRPFGAYVFWNGLWILPPPPLSAQIGIFNGNPTVNFDATGKGLPGAGPVANEQYGWALMNGANGTANLSDKFIIGARMDNIDSIGWDEDHSAWRTNVTGEPEIEGGAPDITLNSDNTYQPPQTASQPVSPFVTQAREVDGADHTGAVYGAIGDGSHDQITLHASEPGNESPEAIAIIPPFYALAFIQWIGYLPPDQ